MRIRTIKPEFWQSEDLANVSDKAKLLAIGLLNISDDEGYLKAHPAVIKSQIFPFIEESVNIQGLLIELSNANYLTLLDGDDGKQYVFIDNFTKHQKVNRPTPSKIRATIEFTESSVNDHEQLTIGKERKGTGKGKEQGKERNEDQASMSDKSDAISVLNYMNESLGTKYKSTTVSHIENINGRLSEGHSVEDCKLVIDSKKTEWLNDPKMAGYLRPQTLFQVGKFQGYLIAAKTSPVKSGHNLSNKNYVSEDL
jgi:uncharacterized phage protein (TIGR02220 family)